MSEAVAMSADQKTKAAVSPATAESAQPTQGPLPVPVAPVTPTTPLQPNALLEKIGDAFSTGIGTVSSVIKGWQNAPPLPPPTSATAASEPEKESPLCGTKESIANFSGNIHDYLVPIASDAEYRARWLTAATKGSRPSFTALIEEYNRYLREAKSWTTMDPKVLHEFEAIERDVCRTFAATDLVESPLAKDRLRRLLAVYSLSDPDVGYVQALNFVGAFILAYIPDDAEAYALFTKLMQGEKYHMRSCFLPDLPDVELYGYVIRRLLWDHLPRLALHFEQVGVEPIFWFEWYFTLFTLVLPRSLCAEAWSWFLEDGWVAVFRIILALLAALEPYCLGQDFQKTLVVLKGYQRFKLESEIPAAISESSTSTAGDNAHGASATATTAAAVVPVAATASAESSVKAFVDSLSKDGVLPTVQSYATTALSAVSSLTSIYMPWMTTPPPTSSSATAESDRLGDHKNVIAAFNKPNNPQRNSKQINKTTPAATAPTVLGDDKPKSPPSHEVSARQALTGPVNIADEFIVAPPLNLLELARKFHVTAEKIDEYLQIARRHQADNAAAKAEDAALRAALEASKNVSAFSEPV